MAGRILVVEESKPVLAALARGAAAAGFAMDAVGAPDATGVLDPRRHAVAVVRAGPQAEALVAALRRADPSLPVIAIFEDEDEAELYPGGLGADAVLLGPLAPQVLASVVRLAARARAQARRIAALQRAHARSPAQRELEFLKRLLFVEVKRSRRHRYPIALALLAVDRWDEVVGRAGARSRARLLADAYGVVKAAIRDIDLAVPFTRDRILVLMPHTKSDGSVQVGRRLVARIRERVGTPHLTASVGLAAHGGEGPVSFSTLVKRAGEALQRAQAAGGDRAESADPPRKRDRISIG